MKSLETPSANPPQGVPGCYQLLRTLGIGSVGEVWEAQSEGRSVALKILHGVHLSRSSLENEFELLMKLAHPNIVEVHGIHQFGEGRALIEMEKVDGSSLSTIAAESGGFLSWGELKPLALQLCRALGYAHSKEIVHRDVKPSNLLVDKAGNLKLMQTESRSHELTEEVNLTPGSS